MRNPQIGDLVFARAYGCYQSEARVGVLVKISNEFAWLYGHHGADRCIIQGMMSVPPILWTDADKQLIVQTARKYKIETMYTMGAEALLLL
ncbi:MAG: hypothetical protein AAB795_00410 [Patescibacteria group bacterium]